MVRSQKEKRVLDLLSCSRVFAPPPSQSLPSPRVREGMKRRRVGRACDFCHSRGIKVITGPVPPKKVPVRRCSPSPLVSAFPLRCLVQCAPNADPNNSTTCQSCESYGTACTFVRVMKKRGVSQLPLATFSGFTVRSLLMSCGQPPAKEFELGVQDQPPTSLTDSSGPEIQVAGSSTPTPSTSTFWQAPYVVSLPSLLLLVDCYHNVVYPLYVRFIPSHLFHQTDLLLHSPGSRYSTGPPSAPKSLEKCTSMTVPSFRASCPLLPLLRAFPFHFARPRSRSTFLLTLTLAIKPSGRIRDGATPLASSDLLSVSPEAFVAYAEAALPHDLTLATGFDYLRATGLLAVTSIQLSQQRNFHRWMGSYLTLVAMDSLHDEGKWDKKMGAIEREERRRLVCLVLSSSASVILILIGPTTSSSGQCLRWKFTRPSFLEESFAVEKLRVPSPFRQRWTTNLLLMKEPTFEINLSVPQAGCKGGTLQRLCTVSLVGFLSLPSPFSFWLISPSFNPAEVLEHAIGQLRDRNQQSHQLPSFNPISPPSPLPSTFLDFVTTSYAQLPALFQQTSPFSGVPSQDRFSFQTANIIITSYVGRIPDQAFGGR